MGKDKNKAKKLPKLVDPNTSPGFDIGFQLQEQNNLENQLGTAAINTETVHDAIKDGLDLHLTQAQTNTSLAQTTLTDQLHTALQKAGSATGTIQQELESTYASQLGIPLDNTVLIAPNHPDVVPLSSHGPAAALVAVDPTQYYKPYNTTGVPIGVVPYIQDGVLVYTDPNNSTVALPYPGGIVAYEANLAGTPLASQAVVAPLPGFTPQVGLAAPIVGNPGPVIQFPFAQSGLGVDCATWLQLWRAGTFNWFPVNGGVYQDPRFPALIIQINWQDTVDANGNPCREVWGTTADANGNPTGPLGNRTHCSCTISTTPPFVPPIPSPPVTTSPPTIPPTTPPTIPPTQPCPPVIKFPDCFKICETPPLKEKPCKYCLYCTENKTLYIVRETDPPRSSMDKKLTCGDPLEWQLQSAINECMKQQTTSPSPVGYYDSPPVSGIASGCGDLFAFPFLQNPVNFTFFTDFFEQAQQRIQAMPQSGNSIIDYVLSDFIPWIGTLFGETLDGITSGATNIVGKGGCATPNQMAIIGMRGLLGIVRRYVSDAAEGPDTQAAYAQNFNCPWKLPSAETATAAYMTDSIDLERLRCIVQANGNLWEPWKSIIDSNRTRWNPAETMMLWRRNFISKPYAYEYLRQLGYLSDIEKDGLAKLTEQVPGVADIVSMMLRDVADEKNIDWSNSDRIFQDKYTGQLKTWGENQGIPEDMAKYLWRAHWQLPSPTQLFDFWQRLRKGGKFGTEDELEKRIRGVLLQNDYHPDWIDEYMAIALRPLTRVDAGRAYEIGAISRNDLELVYNELGYNDKNAKTLVEFKSKQIREKYKKSPYLKSYARGEISRGDLDGLLLDAGLADDIRNPLLDYASNLLRLERRKVCVKSYRKRFLLGEFDRPQVEAKLAADGLDASQVQEISTAWECEKTQRGKVVPANTLCGWYERGTIDEVELYTRLKRLGYVEDDAAKLTRDCMTRNGIKIDKERQAALAKEIRQQRQAAAAAKKLAHEFDAAVEKDARQREKIAKARQDRQKLLIKMGEVYATKVGMDLPDAVVGIQILINKAISTGLAPINVVYQGAATLADDPTVTDFEIYSRELAALLVSV